MPILFTMNADAKNFVAPTVVGYRGLEIHFDLNVEAGQFLKDSSTTRASLLLTERVTGYIRSDGRMYDTAAVQSAPYDLNDPGNVGVRLVANDPALNLTNAVSYTVSFGTKIDGKRIPTPFASFNTPAVPSTDTTVDLASFAPGPGQTVVGVPALNVVDNLTDATAVGKAVVRAADAAAARTAIQPLGLVQAAKNPDLLVTGAITVDGNDLLTSAAVLWPDGSPGTMTVTSRDSNKAVLGYNITYGSPVTKTYSQPTITRNANGAATNVPAIVVS